MRRGWLALACFALVLGACSGDDESDPTAATSAAAGSSGMGSGGSGGAAGQGPIAPLPGEYDLVIDQIVPLGTYAMSHEKPTHLHLSLQRQETTLEAWVSGPFGTQGKFTLTYHPEVALSASPSKSPASVDGPLLLEAGSEHASVGNDSYQRLALSLDETGRPTEAVGVGFHYFPGLICKQNASGDAIGLQMHAAQDTTPPSLQGSTAITPWNARLALSEPIVTPSAPTVEGATIGGIENEGLALIPRFADLLALSGKTVFFSFASLHDLAGNSAPASASLTFVDLGPPSPSFDFSTENEPCGQPIHNQVMRLSKPGATRLKALVCSSQGLPSTKTTVTVRAWSSSGDKTETTIEPVAKAMTWIELTLPASDVGVDVSATGCGGARLGKIEAF